MMLWKASASDKEETLLTKYLMAQHNQLGKIGEDLACNYLMNHGYTIMSRNFIYQKAEVDIIAKKGNYLAIVEVKTRSTSDFGDPQDFLKPKQIQRIVLAVDEFVNSNQLDVNVRFDIIAIVKNNSGVKIEHLKDAFYHF